MLHVRIRTPHDAFHFFGEVSPYNLQTVRQHVRQSLRESGRLTVSLQIDPSDEPLFARFVPAWLRQLGDNGTAVEINETSARTPGRTSPAAPRMVLKLTAGTTALRPVERS